jgi:hypothetical protein
MNDATSLSDLKIDPIGGNSMGANISMTATEQYDPNINMNPQSGPTMQEQIQGGGILDESTVHLLINGLQKAAMSGATKLPSRDIQMMPTNYTNDREINPIYIPEPIKKNYDYIQEEYNGDVEDNEKIINNYKKKEKKSEYIDEFYNEIQIPLLLGVLYFFFQLPFFKKWLFRYLPNLFLKDGNLNLYGFGFTSFIFGLIYYIVNKVSIISVRLGNF